VQGTDALVDDATRQNFRVYACDGFFAETPAIRIPDAFSFCADGLMGEALQQGAWRQGVFGHFGFA
jgi:hypothetical protein